MKQYNGDHYNTGNDGECSTEHVPKIFEVVLTLASSSSGTTADHVEVERYDPYSNTWNMTCPALKYVSNFTATACHGKLYIIGSCAVKYNALTMQCYNPVIGKDLDHLFVM